MSLSPPGSQPSQMPIRRIIRTWWPLAASWLLMSAELPALSAVVARLPNPEINLAAYGGIISPLALIVESPIIMLLAASTALSKDWASYVKVRRFMMWAGAALTLLHALVAFTPLYYLIVNGLLGAPEEIVAPARLGLMILLPWTWSIAYRRFHQGVLIRFGRSKAVGMGTVIRLSADCIVLAAGYFIHSLPGAVVASCAVSAGVVCEAAYAGWVVRPVLRTDLKAAPAVETPVTLVSFLHFYIPLAMTSLLALIVQPIGSAALSRMPQALASLAVWPVVSGLISMLRSLGTAFNEVVVALLDERYSSSNLRRFTTGLALLTTVFLLLVVSTPLARFWFGTVSALDPQLANIARISLWIALPMPGLAVLQSWYQGAILHSRRTRGITEAVVIFLIICTLTLVGGATWGRVTGLYIGMAAFVLSTLIQTAWLWQRSRSIMSSVKARDAILPGLNTPGTALE